MKCGYRAATLPEAVTAQYRPDSTADAAARTSSHSLGTCAGAMVGRPAASGDPSKPLRNGNRE